MGSQYCRVRNICQPYYEKEVSMPLGLIFAIGGLCSVLCISFFLVHYFEVKRLDSNPEYNDPFVGSREETK